jgi:hypothetical protein
MGATALTDRCHQRTRCLQIGGVHIWGDEEPQRHPGRREMLGFVPHPNPHELSNPQGLAMAILYSHLMGAHGLSDSL